MNTYNIIHNQEEEGEKAGGIGGHGQGTDINIKQDFVFPPTPVVKTAIIQLCKRKWKSS